MKYIFLLYIPIISCMAQKEELNSGNTVEPSVKQSLKINEDSLEIEEFYNNHSQSDGKSRSIGTVSNGKLENGKLIPFYGVNYTYFDRESYLSSRAFTSDAVKTIVLNTYEELHNQYPQRKFYLMELSNHHGGKIYPHRTHQNGLSVDFMMPKLKNDQANYDLDTLGKQHYFLEFNDRGEFLQDTSIKIDFNLMAKHILLLQEEANKINYSIEKVIIKLEYKDELFNTVNGQLLKQSGIYFAKNLSPLVNEIHDDHFHVDFKMNK